MLNVSFSDDEKHYLVGPGLQLIEMLNAEGVGENIPPFRAVFSPHDNPNLLVDWQLRQEAVKAARQGRCK
ncbi:hypothetical protein AN958_08357 [Leucoagaricus sp. SymC.cos]|nr:hypothetical protein AN958_08357 [Leucoagaricus sp. SymC.cos]